MTTNRTICRYTTVRFLPYPDRDEFVNVGVLTAFPLLGTIDFKLEINHTKRITDFFPGFIRSDYKRLARKFYETFDKIRSGCIETPLFGTDDAAFNSFFELLTKQYDELFQFSKSRTCFTSKPETETENLFARFVRQTATSSTPSHENEMVTKIRKQLKYLTAVDDYVDCILDLGSGMKMNIPFAKIDEENHLLKAIRPLFLGYNDVNRITDHGGGWLLRLDKAREQNLLPDKTLIVIGGMEERNKNKNAIIDIMTHISKIDAIEVTAKSDIELIEDFVS